MKYVYAFHEGNKDMKNLLGGKGANLAEMTAIGLPVPQGFTITTDACLKYYDEQETLNGEVITQIKEKLQELEQKSGKKLGDTNNPLLLSVRSGAQVSMPGMMDTILNLGMNDEVAAGFAISTGNPRFVYDNYRRLIQMFADVVMGFPKSSFEYLFDKMKVEKGVALDSELTTDDLKEIVGIYKQEYLKNAGAPFPEDPEVQLLEAVKAVFRSWNNERAITYRKLNHIPSEWGTAVNVQEMVYGNKNDMSGTGVAFTRNPATGEDRLYGEYLMNAQGEDVVAGIRTPKSIETLQEIMPECYREFSHICRLLEDHYKDMQDMEFTIEDGHLFMLQTRNGKRTAKAAIKIAVDMVNAGKITKEEALLKIQPEQLNQLLHPNFTQESLESAQVIAEGLAASPGAATGKIYFTTEDVIDADARGEKDLLLIRGETSPEDIEGMNLVHGILTVRGGMTSHAAVVARGMGTCCVCGCDSITVDEASKTLTTKDGAVFHEGDYMSFDGSTGRVYGEQLATMEPEIFGDFETFMDWADEIRRLGIRANADTPKDAKQARKFGAEGIGLCRTEHMFFDEARLLPFRQMIVADTEEKRKVALDKILPFQRDDFAELYRVMEGDPVIIRFLDPPLHEFLPHTEEEVKELAISLDMTFENMEHLRNRIADLKEFNPMMGHRGCRLAVTYPEIARMQTRAVIEAALIVQEEGYFVKPEIMIPLIGDKKEYLYVKNLVCQTAEEVLKEKEASLNYLVGTMIEVPRATITADEIAKEADFFSFGTNDLTQMTYGFSRDDASKFLQDYYKENIFDFDPFATIDQKGVGVLLELGTRMSRRVKRDISLGICGEHGGDPQSIEFCNKIGLDYVSCSPYRVPVARLAAAQASIREKSNK